MKTKEDLKGIYEELGTIHQKLKDICETLKNTKELNDEEIKFMKEGKILADTISSEYDLIKEEMGLIILNKFTDFKTLFDKNPAGFSHYISNIIQYPFYENGEILIEKDYENHTIKYNSDIEELYSIKDPTVVDNIANYDNFLIGNGNLELYFMFFEIKLEDITVPLIEIRNSDEEEIYTDIAFISKNAYETNFNKNFLKWFEENKDYCKVKVIQFSDPGDE